MNAIINRADARAIGSKYYFTGKPCRRGHVGNRYVSTGGCVACKLMTQAEWGESNAHRARATTAAWRAANVDKKRSYDATWRSSNADRIRAIAAAWRAANVERKRAYDAARYASKRVKAAAGNGD